MADAEAHELLPRSPPPGSDAAKDATDADAAKNAPDADGQT
jgi:hypothetical protein